jgi:iron complex transport system substrate-binding protein
VLPRNGDQIDFERVAALAPDLVIGQYCGMTQADHDRLSKIAPTVAQSAAHPDYGMPWEETTRVVGSALGRPDQAEQLIRGVEDRFAAARAAHPGLAGRSAVVVEQFEPNTYFVRSASDPRTRFLTSVGCVLPDDLAQLAGAQDGATISAEQVGLLDRDLVVWNAGFESELPARLRADPLYPRLRAAREGRDVLVTDQTLSGALTWSTVLSIPFAIDRLVPQLAAAVDGDPATRG